MPAPLPVTVLGKVIAHWLVTGLPLILLSPLAALLLSLDMAGWRALALTLLDPGDGSAALVADETPSSPDPSEILHVPRLSV